MSRATRRYYRTLFLSIAAMGALVWVAVDEFELSVLFLEIFEAYPNLSISLHMSGPLAKWLDDHQALSPFLAGWVTHQPPQKSLADVYWLPTSPHVHPLPLGW